MARLPDIVRLAKLDTQFEPDSKCTRHTQSIPSTKTRGRVVRTEEWKKEKELGRGSFGIVWLERCKQGGTKGSLRAVKEVKKLPSSNYHRELEAFALFSYSQYEQCFVKSLGWYDDHHSVFIAMEYLPNGDLQRYLSSPLPENEGQDIVSQILEGLTFMHDAGFTHRDLKPANLLVVEKGPDWWIKITDFGISKRATEGLTALQTVTGTPAFAAPEILGFFHADDTPNEFYTNSVDIWSLGVIAYLVLTGEILFRDQRRLGQFVAGRFAFPSHILSENNISEEGCDFVEILMAPKSDLRPEAKECLQHPWLNQVTKASEVQRPPKIPKASQPSIINIDPEPSTRSSTRVETSAPEMRDSTTNLARDLGRKSRNLSSNGEQLGYVLDESTIIIWDTATGVVRCTFNPDCVSISALAISRGGEQIIYSSTGCSSRLWNKTTGESRKLVGLNTACVFSSSGKQFASVETIGMRMRITLWDSVTLMKHREYCTNGSTTSVAFSADDKQIALGLSSGLIELWDISTGVCSIFMRDNDKGVIVDVALSPDGKQIASSTWLTSHGPRWGRKGPHRTSVAVVDTNLGTRLRRYLGSS